MFSLRIALFCLVVQVYAQMEETRGIWVATVDNIDWPSAPALSTQQQRQEISDYLDVLSSTNFNTIFIQMRPAGDALYSSTLEPWSKYLTGEQGIAPEPLYDPLAEWVTGGHSRGMQVHAWLNPYRANLSPDWEGLTPDHMANKYREYAYPYSSYLWMDPAAAPVQAQLLQVVVDIITRYDVDGIHFDDYFYPYPEEGVPFPDDETYNNYTASGGTMSRDDWRRDNVNRLVEAVYAEIKGYDTTVKFSVSPFGLYKPGQPGGMPLPIEGFDPYSEVYADAKWWLQQGWMDIFIPQIYWEIEPPEQSYPVILDWWLGVNNASCEICAGNAVYKTNPDAQNWPVSEIVDQIDISRLPDNRARGSLGNVHFSAIYFKDNVKNITTIFADGVYSEPAPVPLIETKDVVVN